MRVIVADDERPARDELKYLLSKIQEVKVIAEAASGEEVLNLVRELEPDVLFLDIQMPDMSGVEVARILVNEGHELHIVFATAYDEYAINAFDVNAVDYLLKPFDEERLLQTIDRLKKQIDKAQRLLSPSHQVPPEEVLNKLNDIYSSLRVAAQKERRLKVEENGRIILVPVSDIVYATVDDRSVRIVTVLKNYLTNYKLHELEHILGSSFLRVHKSYLVNIDRIQVIIPWFNNTYNLVMSDESEIPVSRTYVKMFRERMGL